MYSVPSERLALARTSISSAMLEGIQVSPRTLPDRHDPATRMFPASRGASSSRAAYSCAALPAQAAKALAPTNWTSLSLRTFPAGKKRIVVNHLLSTMVELGLA